MNKIPKFEIPKEFQEQMIKNMELYTQTLFSRELEKAYQILLTIAQMLRSRKFEFEDGNFERFYHLLRGDIQDDLLQGDGYECKRQYEFSVNFFSIEPKGESLYQDPTGHLAIEYLYTRSGVMNISDHILFTQYLIQELDKIAPQIMNEIYNVILASGSM